MSFKVFLFLFFFPAPEAVQELAEYSQQNHASSLIHLPFHPSDIACVDLAF